MGRVKKAALLDRDGVINRLMLERGPRETPLKKSDVELLPKVKEALIALRRAGFLLIVVTNQPNVAKGKSTLQECMEINTRLRELLGKQAWFDKIYACRHHPDPKQVVVQRFLKECSCRKPKPGLLLRAMEEFGIREENAYTIGDSQTDMQAGIRAGLPLGNLIFIGKSYDNRIAAVRDLWTAVQLIIKLNKLNKKGER